MYTRLERNARLGEVIFGAIVVALFEESIAFFF